MEWISVKDEKPRQEFVLVTRNNCDSPEARKPFEAVYYPALDEWRAIGGCVIQDVTHWMPLPEPPKED